MEQLLEAISDAVSSMVLYSVEADESNAAIPNILPGAQGVKSTVDYLVDLASKSAALWDNFNQPDMKLKMIDTCDKIKEATGFLLESATILSNMPFNKPAKKILLKGAKGIMEHMVVLLQQADLYEVTRLIRYCRRCESKLKIFIGLDPGETFFATAAQDFVTSTVEVGKIVGKRIGEIDDYALKKRFEESNTSLKVEVPVVLQHFAYYQRDGNDRQSYNNGQRVAKTIFAIIDEIIVVARLSAKSPFDLSMIQGLDLRDDDDLKDANILISQEKSRLLSAIEAGDGKEASRALKAIKKGLTDQIVISKALAKSTDNPIEKKRLEDAARQAQFVLDGIIAQFGQSVEELLARPDNSLLFNRLKANLDTIMEASDQMVTSSARLSSNDVEESTKNLEDLIERCKSNIVKSEVDKLHTNVPLLQPTFTEILDIIDGIASATEDPTIKSTLEYASREARQRGTLITGRLERLVDTFERDLSNKEVQDEMTALLNQLDQMGKDLLRSVSLGTSSQIYDNHRSIQENLGALRQAIVDGDKKEMQNALRSIRKGMNDQLNVARSMVRTTDDQHIKDALQAAILKADDELNDLIKNLFTASQFAIQDASNPSAMQSLEDAIGDVDSMNAQFLGAVSRDLMQQNTRQLESKLAQLIQSIKTGDQQATVTVLKGVIEDIKKQGLVAELASNSIRETDEERSNRIRDRAIELTNTGPSLVKSVKASLVEMNSENLGALVQNIGMIRETNKDLNNAVFLSTEEELLENSAKIDQEMRRIQTALANGQPITMAEVNSLMKKMNNQIRLAHQHSKSLKDPNSKKVLLDSTENLNKLVSLLVDACKNQIQNPNDQASKDRVQQLLDQAIKANLDLIGGSFSTAEELVYGTPHLLKLISRLEDAIANGDIDEIKRCFKELNEELSRQLFLARIAESSITDPERKKLLQEAIADLELLQQNIYPSLMEFIANPNSLEARNNLNRLLAKLKNEVERVSSISSSSPTEHLESKSYSIANELIKVEKALEKNNSVEANDGIQKAMNGIKQQIQLSKHIADSTDDISQKRSIVSLSDRLEKQALVLLQAVKDSLANPNSQPHKAKVVEASNATRTLMAKLIAASSNKVPEDQIINTAHAIKRDLDQLSSQLSSPSTSKQERDALLSQFRSGELQQKVELLKAYAEKVSNPSMKKQIYNAISDLEKNVKSTIQSIDSVNGKPGGATVDDIKKLVSSLDQTSKSASQVVTASTGTNEDRLLSKAVKISNTLDAIQKQSKAGNKTNVDSNLKELREELGDTINLIKQASDQVRDQHKKVALNEIAEKLKSVSQPIANVAGQSCAKPSDKSLETELKNLVNQTKELLSKAVGNSSNNDNSSDQLDKVLFKASNDINRINHAIESGDQDEISNSISKLQETENKLTILSSSLPSSSAEHEKVKQSINAINNVIIPTILENSTRVLVNPKDSKSKQSISTDSKKAIDDLSKLISLTNKTPEENIISNGTIIHRDTDQLLNNAIKSGDRLAVENNVDTLYKTVSEQSVLARALASQTNNQSRKQELQSKALELENLLPKLSSINQSIQQDSNSGSGKPIDKSLVDKLEKVTSDIKSVNQKIVSEAINEKLEKEHKEREAREAAFKAEQERLQREKEEREKAQQDEVFAAAQKIAERTKDLNKDQTPEGKLYSTAQGIAGIMRDLSIAASTNDKKGMIQCSKLLADQVNLYLTQAKETAAKCTDPKLKEQIITAAQAAKNFTVQLKIIAAVKAASDDDDPNTNKQQLVKCAKGLAKAIVQTINSVEIGQIRVK